MRAVREWSVRHSVPLKRTYDFSLRFLPALRLLMRLIGKRRLDWGLRPLERALKGLMFDCKMCGQCALSSTGMACPTNCAKGMRNGPCGGVRANGNCEVIPDMRCVWVEAAAGRARLQKAGIPSVTALPPLDYRLFNTSSWVAAASPLSSEAWISGSPSHQQRDAMVPVGNQDVHSFEAACKSGRIVVTVEIAPPDTADSRVLLDRAAPFRDLADAVNITDGAGANCHVSSVAAAAILGAAGYATVAQFSCRDRNRIGIQADILGAAALGVRNILCLTGDGVGAGDHPMAKPVFDVDSIALLRIARRMRDAGEFASGRKLLAPPSLFIGATVNPFVPPHEDRIRNLEDKVNSGARFIQTQFCFDLDALSKFMQQVRARGLHRRAAILVGVGVLNSAKALSRMRNVVPGVHIPQSVIERIAAASDQIAAGQRILVENLRAIAAIEGVAGVHLMGFKNERVLAQAIVESGVRDSQRVGFTPAAVVQCY